MNEKKDDRPIVCGTDFSVTALEAVDLAAAIARKLDTKLVLVYVDEFRGLAAVDPTLFEATLSKAPHSTSGRAGCDWSSCTDQQTHPGLHGRADSS